MHCHTALHVIQYRGRTTKKVKKQITGGAVEAGCAATGKVFCVCNCRNYIATLTVWASASLWKMLLIILPIEKPLSYLKQLNSYQVVKKWPCELRGESLPLNSFSDHSFSNLYLQSKWRKKTDTSEEISHIRWYTDVFRLLPRFFQFFHQTPIPHLLSLGWRVSEKAWGTAASSSSVIKTCQ